MFLQTESSPAWRDCIEATNQAQKVSMRKHRSHGRDAVIRVYDEAGNMIETHEHTGDFREW
jgi:hypothetical protein